MIIVDIIIVIITMIIGYKQQSTERSLRSHAAVGKAGDGREGGMEGLAKIRR